MQPHTLPKHQHRSRNHQPPIELANYPTQSSPYLQLVGGPDGMLRVLQQFPLGGDVVALHPPNHVSIAALLLCLQTAVQQLWDRCCQTVLQGRPGVHSAPVQRQAFRCLCLKVLPLFRHSVHPLQPIMDIFNAACEQNTCCKIEFLFPCPSPQPLPPASGEPRLNGDSCNSCARPHRPHQRT